MTTALLVFVLWYGVDEDSQGEPGSHQETHQREPAQIAPRVEDVIAAIRAEMDRGVQDQIFSAAAFGWIHRGELAAAEYAGMANEESIFDLASLTKPIFAASVIALLQDRGMLSVSDPVTKYFPEWETCTSRRSVHCQWRKKIRVEDLLRHLSGLRDGAAFPGDSSFKAKVQEALKAGRDSRSVMGAVYPSAEAGGNFVYQDVNFAVLTEIARAVLKAGDPSGSIESFYRSQVLNPLGMKSTFMHVVPERRKSQAVQTAADIPVGTPHDPLARIFPEIAGNAGLFMNLPDALAFAGMILKKGHGTGREPVFSEAAVQGFGRPAGPGDRGLGWDVLSPYSDSIRGGFREGMGHSGYTGTSMWIVPLKGTAFVLLTNRTWFADDERTKARIKEIRTFVADQIFRATR